MDVALARLARVAEGNHINLLNSGQSSLPPPSGGKPATSLFGSLNTSQPQQNANSIQAQTSSLFGNTTQPAQASSLFGNTTSQPAQTSSLFGNVSSLPQQGGGMFGSNQNQAGNNQQQQQGSSLFGGNENTQSGGGLFGSQQTNQQTLGGLFGSTNAQQTQPQQASLFDSVGQSQAQHPQATLLSGTGSQNRTSSLLFVLSHTCIAFRMALDPDLLANDYVVVICLAQSKINSLPCSHPQSASCSRVKSVNTLNSRPYQASGSSMSTSFAPQHVSMIYTKICKKSLNTWTILF